MAACSARSLDGSTKTKCVSGVPDFCTALEKRTVFTYTNRLSCSLRTFGTQRHNNQLPDLRPSNPFPRLFRSTQPIFPDASQIQIPQDRQACREKARRQIKARRE